MAEAGSRRVGVVLSTEMGCFRSMLRGINAFAVTRPEWCLELCTPAEDFLTLIRQNRPHGLLIGPVSRPGDALAAIRSVEKRAVSIGTRFGDDSGEAVLPSVESDDIQVGEMAAAHFLEKGFRHFAFLGIDAWWSHGRLVGFERALARDGYEPARLVPPSGTQRTTGAWPLPHYGEEVLDWLRPLPRPLAMFACNDLRGRAVAELCRSNGLRVPEDVAILGVDNDDLECELSHPPLSSVAVAWRRLGFEGARLLDRLLNGEPVASEPLRLAPESVVVRPSTDTSAIRDPDVAAAARFIRQNAHRPIGVADLLRVVPAARRSLEKRFRAALGRSPLEEIRRVRIERAKQLLSQTDAPMPHVATESGFASAAWFSRAFHDLAGETPTQYRQRSRVR